MFAQIQAPGGPVICLVPHLGSMRIFRAPHRRPHDVPTRQVSPKCPSHSGVQALPSLLQTRAQSDEKELTECGAVSDGERLTELSASSGAASSWGCGGCHSASSRSRSACGGSADEEGRGQERPHGAARRVLGASVEERRSTGGPGISLSLLGFRGPTRPRVSPASSPNPKNTTWLTEAGVASVPGRTSDFELPNLRQAQTLHSAMISNIVNVHRP